MEMLKTNLLPVWLLCLLWLAPVHAQTPSPNPGLAPSERNRNLVDQLGPNQFQEILNRLRASYVDPTAVNTKALDQAAMVELLSRLGSGVQLRLRSELDKPIANRPFRRETLNDHFGYVRCGTLDKNVLVKLDDALGNFRSQNVQGVIVDLRTTPESTDYELAGQFVSRFVSKGTLVFRVVSGKSDQDRSFVSPLDPLYQGPLAVLMDEETAGAAEIIAAALKTKAHALLIGEKSVGRAAEYQSSPVGNNLLLTLAVTQIQVPDLPAIFPNGIQPDVSVVQPLDLEHSILAETDTQSSAPSITDEPRQHLNEAALVAGTNPELDAYEAQQSGRLQPAKPKDIMLQRAVDFLVTVNLYKGA
jgi:Peptidase family S41